MSKIEPPIIEINYTTPSGVNFKTVGALIDDSFLELVSRNGDLVLIEINYTRYASISSGPVLPVSIEFEVNGVEQSLGGNIITYSTYQV